MFQGFCPDTIDFLWGIKLNNRRDWFEEHKAVYLETLYTPMKALGEAVYEPLRDVPGLRLHVSRIYRDARYANGIPYKDSLWLSVRHDGSYWAQLPCLYFDLHPDYYGYGFGIVYPEAAAMERFRALIAEKPEDFLNLVKKTKKSTGFDVTGAQYSRKKPCPDKRLAPYYNLKQVLCLTQKPIGPELFSPGLAGTVGAALKGLLPFYDYCQKFAY